MMDDNYDLAKRGRSIQKIDLVDEFFQGLLKKEAIKKVVVQ